MENTPRLVQESLENSNLEKINRGNLQEGIDSEGNDMPRYRNPDYANFKVSINPKNRGFWDLRLHGEYYRGIEAKIYPSIVFFHQRFSNEKIDWINERVGKRPLGISKNQMEEVQLKNIPKLKKQIEKIINGV